ncbi:MAG: DUF3828 domain-containing protein [Pseudomonadales bacterium]|nr:DUF3828 domain-containing protein [Pseudomonadales bacterium]
MGRPRTAALLLALCTTACVQEKPVASDPVGRAITAPLTDLNLVRQKIPAILKSARQQPYAPAAAAGCESLAAEIVSLDAALGRDLDRPRPPAKRVELSRKGAEEVSDAATDAMQDLTTGWIPARGWVRRLTGAERYSREVAAAIRAGLIRRAYLKGLGQAQGCEAPAAPRRLMPDGVWRFTHALPAPWSDAELDSPDLVGESLALHGNTLTGPPLFACDDAVVEQFSTPLEGLFEGGLASAGEIAARGLGFTALPVETLRIACRNASFDYHRVDDETWQVGLDNRVWSLSNTPGTHAVVQAPDSAQATAQRLLERHFAGARGFLPANVDRVREFLSRRLQAAMADYFARPVSPDEAPVIDGDAFTDSQEYPTRFAVGQQQGDADRETVRVRFADGYSARTIAYVFVRENDAWRLDDILYAPDSTLRQWLATPP